MQTRSRNELYASFVEFVRGDVQKERHLVNRRMFNVFLWCFLLPVATTIFILLLVKFHVMPRSAKALTDWFVLIFPVFYSLYILSSEVLSEIPASFKRGGIATSLGHAAKDSVWRERACDSMAREVNATPQEWKWIIENFSVDLRNMQYRNRYLTALAGAVLFLIMQGIDSIGGDSAEPKVTWVKSALGWVETQSNDFPQFVGLALFLVLLYLSGNQTYFSLSRYKDCAELLQTRPDRKN